MPQEFIQLGDVTGDWTRMEAIKSGICSVLEEMSPEEVVHLYAGLITSPKRDPKHVPLHEFVRELEDIGLNRKQIGDFIAGRCQISRGFDPNQIVVTYATEEQSKEAQLQQFLTEDWESSLPPADVSQDITWQGRLALGEDDDGVRP
jgi:hypothetical protein